VVARKSGATSTYDDLDKLSLAILWRQERTAHRCRTTAGAPQVADARKLGALPPGELETRQVRSIKHNQHTRVMRASWSAPGDAKIEGLLAHLPAGRDGCLVDPSALPPQWKARRTADEMAFEGISLAPRETAEQVVFCPAMRIFRTDGRNGRFEHRVSRCYN
jgi:hypothetical protein